MVRVQGKQQFPVSCRFDELEGRVGYYHQCLVVWWLVSWDYINPTHQLALWTCWIAVILWGMNSGSFHLVMRGSCWVTNYQECFVSTGDMVQVQDKQQFPMTCEI